MKLKFQKKNPRLGEKLKYVMQNLAVDVFGYESKVTKNIITYFSRLSKETCITQDELVVRIFKDRATIRVVIYKQGKPVKEIPVKELIRLFTNTTAIFHMETKVIQGIKIFMKDFSTAHTMDIDGLHICIMTRSGKAWIKGYDGVTPIRDIPLGVLIKHFMR